MVSMKDLQRMLHEITTRVSNIETAQSLDSDERADITDSLEDLESRFNGVLARLANVEGEVLRNAIHNMPGKYTVSLDVDGKVSGIRNHRLEFKSGEAYTTRQDPRSQFYSYQTGDKYIAPDGEPFWWYLGQWRRLSELEGFRDGLRDCGINL